VVLPGEAASPFSGDIEGAVATIERFLGLRDDDGASEGVEVGVRSRGRFRLCEGRRGDCRSTRSNRRDDVSAQSTRYVASR